MRRATARALAALADGTLPRPKRAALLRRVARSAKASRALEDQRFAVEVVRSLADPAPARLRELLEQGHQDGPVQAPRPPSRGSWP